MSYEVILCDADSNLFASEEPAFEASAIVTNRLLAELGVGRHLAPDELRAIATGRTFRSTASWLAAQHGVALHPRWLERYVDAERREVMAYLGRVLAPTRPSPARCRRYASDTGWPWSARAHWSAWRSASPPRTSTTCSRSTCG